MNYGTYTLVDTVAGGNGERNAQVIRTGGATSSTWLTDIRVDQLKWSHLTGHSDNLTKYQGGQYGQEEGSQVIQRRV
jgi:hypothetical protein